MTPQDIPKASTGMPGLDYILNGGLPQGQFILLQGGPGTGKTTLALQFLHEGVRRGNRSLYITFLHAKRDIQRIADSHGWDLKGITIEELPEATACNQTIFPTSEVELGETINAINEVIERVSPERLVFDSVSELQMISDTVFRCRKEVASLKRLLTTRNCTALFTIGESPGNSNEFEHVTDGLVLLQQSAPSFGAVRRTLEVVKMRGMPYMTGRHDFRIKTGGLEIFPNLHAFSSRIRQSPIEEIGREPEQLKSGFDELDTLLGGGLEEGSAALVLGASGVGKSTITSLYARAAATKGMKSLILLFDESIRSYCLRAKGMGLDIYPYISSGLISIRRVSVGEISPGEFSQIVRDAFETHGVRLLVIDTLTGYTSAVSEQSSTIIEIHQLLAFAASRNVLTIMTVAEHGLIGTAAPEPQAISLLSDTVILIRFFEAYGQIRRAISVFKKRYSRHERTIRELRLTLEGIKVGRPLENFEGVLTGVPKFAGSREELIASKEA